MSRVRSQESTEMGVYVIAETRDMPPRAGDLVTRALAGDFSAYEEIYRQYAGRVHALCLRMTANRERAEELTQEAFTRAWEKLSSYRGEAEFATWLHRLTVNVVLGERRSRRRREWKEHDGGEVIEMRHATAEPNPGLGLDLEQAIARLPEKARMVFVLHDVEGHRHDEVARLMGISPGTSKAQLHRARRLLREALNP